MRHQINLTFSEDKHGQPQAQIDINRCDDETGEPIDNYFSGKIVHAHRSLCQERALSIIEDEIKNYEDNFA